MGCGISRPAMDEEATTQPGLLPIRRRIEEIKRNRLRSHKRSKSQLSTRDLLGHDEMEVESLQSDGRKSLSSRLECIREVQEIPVVERMRRNDSVEFNKESLPPRPVAAVEKLDNDQKVEDKEEEKEQKHEHQHEAEVEDEDEEVGNRLGEGPGSPSFREYCFQSSDDSDGITNEESKRKEEKGEKKRRQSIDSSQGSVNELVPKKEHKGMRFRRVLPKAGQAAVKNLLNVKGCYCSNPLNHTNPRLAPVPTS